MNQWVSVGYQWTGTLGVSVRYQWTGTLGVSVDRHSRVSGISGQALSSFSGQALSKAYLKLFPIELFEECSTWNIKNIMYRWKGIRRY